VCVCVRPPCQGERGAGLAAARGEFEAKDNLLVRDAFVCAMAELLGGIGSFVRRSEVRDREDQTTSDCANGQLCVWHLRTGAWQLCMWQFCAPQRGETVEREWASKCVCALCVTAPGSETGIQKRAEAQTSLCGASVRGRSEVGR
jgi:hypothetical protein